MSVVHPLPEGFGAYLDWLECAMCGRLRVGKGFFERYRIAGRSCHVFGYQEGSMGGKLIRTIGMVRAKVKIGMMNLVYNMSRLVQFERGAAALG